MKYEYRIQKLEARGGTLTEVKIDLNKIETGFNEMGNEGWELVSIEQTHFDGGKTNCFFATFKRLKH